MKTAIEQYVVDRVRERRQQKEMSQGELAEHLNVSRGFIGDIENPKKRAKYNLNHINDIAFALGCSPRDLFPEEPFPPTADK